MLKILFISPHGDLIYGGEKSLLLLARELKSRGVQLVVICPEFGVYTEALAAEGVQILKSPISNVSRSTVLRYLSSVYRLWRITRKIIPDAIHCNSTSVAQIAIPVAWMCGVPSVVHVRNDIPCSVAKRLLLPQASGIISNSSFTIAKLRNCISGGKISVVYNPIEIPQHSRVIDKTERPILLFAGQICPIKGVDTFVRVAAKLRDIQPNPRFVVLGNEPYHAAGYLNRIKDLAQELGVLNRIEFMGHVSEIEDYYKAASLVLVPSRKETFGRVAAEAMASGLPVVASNIGGLPEVVDNNSTGFLVDPEDVDGFADRVRFLLGNVEQANNMGQAGRARATKMFSPQSHADKVMQVYKGLLA